MIRDSAQEAHVYAIFEDSGTQVLVRSGDVVNLDLRPLAEGESVLKFDRVLVVGDGNTAAKLGKPFIDGATVTAEVISSIQGEKLTVGKYTRRKGYRRKTGHRQDYIRVKITSING